jgi:hypothetical protein
VSETKALIRELIALQSHSQRQIDALLARLPPAEPEPPPPAGEKAVLLPYNTWSDVETLAQAFCVSAVTLRKKLDAFRAETPKNHGWLEREDPGQRQPVYLYHIATVLPLIRNCPYKGKPAPVAANVGVATAPAAGGGRDDPRDCRCEHAEREEVRTG